MGLNIYGTAMPRVISMSVSPLLDSHCMSLFKNNLITKLFRYCVNSGPILAYSHLLKKNKDFLYLLYLKDLF